VRRDQDDSFTVLLVLRALQTQPEFEREIRQDVRSIYEPWLATFPDVNTAVLAAAGQFTRKWLLNDNPCLYDYVLYDLRWAVLRADPVAYSANVLQTKWRWRWLAAQTTRDGRRRAVAEHNRLREADFHRVDIAGRWRYAEAWVRVRHGLEKSLKQYVARQPAREYPSKSDEVADPETRYRNWRRQLKRIDRILQRIDLPPPPRAHS